MDIKKVILGLTLSLLLGNAVAAINPFKNSIVVASSADDVAFYRGLEAAESGDFQTSLAEWTPLAEQGHAKAQVGLGRMYYKGDGVPKSYKKAVKWYTKAAQQGNSKAQYDLGTVYSEGEGVLTDHKAAVKWYTKAAQQGHSYAQFKLGNAYSKGEGVLKDPKAAVKWYTKAAKLGNGDAQFNLAISYWEGLGNPKSYLLAYMWLSLSDFNGAHGAGVARDTLEEFMDLDQVFKAQEMSIRCLESDYTDC